MATPWGLTCLFIGLNILQICIAHPKDQLPSGIEGPNGQVMGVLVAVMVSVCAVFVLVACVCCKRRSGFKENENENEKKVFRNSPVSASVINETSLSGEDPGHVNPIANAEFTIFTPLSPPHHNNNVFRSQPSVICYTENETAPELNKALNPQIDGIEGIDVSEWFANTEYDFPRSRLKYIRELGTGWFGRVVEGEALAIASSATSSPDTQTWTPVAVRILESSASAHEQTQFLYEAAMYRTGAHPNLLQLLGRSLEATPLLLIHEFFPKGDLKKFLLENKECKNSEIMGGVPLRFCCQLAAALEYLHENNIPHLDLAARTCQISSDLNLKLGDYGLAVTQYPNDYYQGTPSIPVRWCAPESVNHTNTTLQPKKITLAANVWSLAVAFWEICEWGRLPYDWLSDDEVVSQVMGTPHIRLPQPTLNAYYIPPLYRLMEYCWLPDQNRPQIHQIYSMLVHLTKTYTSSLSSEPEINDFSTENFDLRWESFKPNTIIKTDNAKTKSASLTNLHGSFENLADGINDTIIQMDSWLENVASHTDDMQYVRGLSEAIHELDTALASEKTSSSSSFDQTPNSSLGPARSDTVIHMDDSNNLNSLLYLPKRSESGSETEDETWRKRIERGAYSEKVRQKSKSVADLMVLTHIDMNTVKDIFQEELKKLQEERRESLLFVPVQSSDSMDQLKDVTINQDFTRDEIMGNMFSGFSSVNNSQISQKFIDSLESSEPNSLVQDEQSVTEMEASLKAVFNSTRNESIIKDENKIENNLLRSSATDKHLVIEPQIITNYKNDSKTIPSGSDSKLEEKIISEPEIKLIESKIESTTNKSTSQEISSNFDTFLQHAPVLSKIETIQSKETVILTPDSGNKNLEINDNFNQNILSNEILLVKDDDAPNNLAVVSPPEKSIDYRETHSQVKNKIEEIPSSSQTKILEKNHGKPSEHIEQVSVKNTDFSAIQNFISRERNAEFLTTLNKTEVSDEKPVQKEEVESKSEEIIISKEESEDKNLEPKLENLQVNEDIENIIDKIEESQPVDVFGFIQENKLLEENKELVSGKKSEPDEIQTDIVQQITLPEKNIEVTETKIASPQMNEICVQNTDLHLENILEENKELMISEKLKTDELIDIVKEVILPEIETKFASSQINEVCVHNTDLHLCDDTILPQTEKTTKKIDSPVKEEITVVTSNDSLFELPNTMSLAVENISIYKKLDKSSENNEDTIKKNTADFLLQETNNFIPESSANTESDISKEFIEALQFKLETTLAKDLMLIDEFPIINKDLQQNNTITDEKEMNELFMSPLIPELIESKQIQTQEINDEKDLAKNNLQIGDKLVDLLQNEDTNILINIPPPPEFIEESQEDREIQIKDVQTVEENATPTETINILDQLIEPVEEKEIKIEEIVNIEPKIEEYKKKSEELSSEKLLIKSELVNPAKEIKNLEINKEETISKPIKLKMKEPGIIKTLNTKQDLEILNPESVDSEKVSEKSSNIHSEINDDLLQESPVTLSQTLKQVDPVISVKSDDFSLIQNFINNERNNNHQNIISPEVKPELEAKSQKESEENNSNLPSVSSELTSDLLDTSNVQQINQIFNVFNVTIDHKPTLECFTSPVKNYYARPFDQNEIITDINSLLESERKKYESKNSVCTSSLKNDFHPFVNGINSELTNKIIEVLHEKDDHEPKKLAEIALDNLRNLDLNKYEEITNGIENNEIIDKVESKEPKKLSEIILDSLKTHSISEDSGFGSVQCDEKIINGMKISADSLDDILSNAEDEDKIIPEIKEFQSFPGTVSEAIPKKIPEIAFEKLKNSSTLAVQNIEDTAKKSVGDIKEQNNQTPKMLSELVQDSLNKTCVQNDLNNIKIEEIPNTNQNLPDIVLDNLNKTFMKTNEEILINVINDSPSKSLNSYGDKFEENAENVIEDSDKNILNAILDSPRKLSEIVLDSLPCNSPVTSESTDNVSDKTVIEVNKISDNSAENNEICDEVIDKNESGESLELNSPNFILTSTPFKSNLIPKKTEANDSFFSFVSEGDESSDCQTHVILGPCEEYGLGLYSGLKTTFGKFSDDDRPEEEILQFSSNFMPYSEVDTTHNSVDYSLETWDKFLGKSLQDQDNCPSSVFDNFSPKLRSLDVFKGKNKDDVEVNNEELNKTITLTNKKNNDTFTIENEAAVPDATMKEDEPNQAETTQSSWEPGEGWFLHPQTEADELTGQIDVTGADIVDNSYVGFALDEECVNALRNELAAKLPHAQGMSHEEPLEPEEWDIEERNEIIVKYNVYATPLSPIPEESCCDDVYCDQIQHRYLDGSDSESDWSEPCLGQTSQLDEDILVVDTETHTALIIESPSLREPQHRHTPSQDSCCSNDTLFNLEDLNYGLSPQHHGSTTSTQPTESCSEQILEMEIETPKQSPINQIPKIETEENLNSDSTEMNLTYTKPDINIDESENSNHQTVLQDSQESKPESLNKLELTLDPNLFGVAPLPSPEDIPWRQLPASLLTYNEVVQNDKYEIQDSEDGPTDTIENIIDQEDLNLAPENANDDLSDSVRDCTIDTDLYSNLTDIRFSGPCDAQLMSTSFSESADYAEERDWDSGSDTRSSSSGEFIWKEGEHEESLRALHAASHDVGVTEDINPMDAIEEENLNSSGDSDDCEEDMEETEFVPSAWDAQATPTKSALRSPEKSTKRKTQQKGVWFKKQKYHCVYEYPREPESPVAPPTELWRPLSDLSSFADWELDPDSCVPQPFEDTDGSYDVLDKYITRSSYPLASVRHRDLYHLNPFPDFGAAGLSGSDEDFFISSSARPFQTVGQSSQFFPGQNPPKSKFLWQDYQCSSQQSSRDLSDGITPDSGIDDVTPASVSESGLDDILPSRTRKVLPLKYLAALAANKTPPSEQKSVDSSLGGLRHTRNRLKLDLPPSPNSFSSTRTFSIDVCSNDPVINREVPTFTTFGKSRFSVQHVATPTDECPDPLQAGIPKIKNVSFEALPHKPMKLTEKVYILDKSEGERKHNPVEMVQGEASLLDSADEDSGIESSANATLERHQQQILN